MHVRHEPAGARIVKWILRFNLQIQSARRDVTIARFCARGRSLKGRVKRERRAIEIPRIARISLPAAGLLVLRRVYSARVREVGRRKTRLYLYTFAVTVFFLRLSFPGNVGSRECGSVSLSLPPLQDGKLFNGRRRGLTRVSSLVYKENIAGAL